MTLTIRTADFDDPALSIFLEAHLQDMAPHSPAESRHALDIAALRKPTVRLWVAQDEGVILGSCALGGLAPNHEELKSMRTEPRARGRGIASRLLEHVLTDAISRQVKRVSLETGSADFFAPARNFYAKNGFTVCRPFGLYREDPYSTYMTRPL